MCKRAQNVWEWWPNEVMQHTADAVFVTQFLSQFFVSETRRVRPGSCESTPCTFARA
jgi:hypothetical protein